MTKPETIQLNDQGGAPEQKLMISSLICLEQRDNPVEVERGMVIIGRDGQETGVVAAVVVNCHSQKGSHILLGQVPPTADYRLIPLNLIDRIDGETVWLRASSEEIEELPRHQPN